MLRAAQTADAHITSRNGQLRVRSNSPLPDDVMADLRTYRDELARMLLEPSESVTSAYKPWIEPWPNPQQPRLWYPGWCQLCGRRMHDGDYVCPVPELRVAKGDGVLEVIL